MPCTLLVLLTFGLWSCRLLHKRRGQQFQKILKNRGVVARTAIQDVVYNIPSPSEIPYLFEATGAEYNQSLVNSKVKSRSIWHHQR